MIDEFTAALAIIVDPSERYLLQRKDSGYKFGPGKWCLFGGRIEEDETPIDTLKRELKEELNLDVKDLEFYKKFYFEGKLNGVGINVEQNVFIVRFNGDLSGLSLGEGAGFSLFEKSELQGLDIIVDDLKVIEDYVGPDFIPVCRPWLPGNEKKYVQECMDSNWISSSGKFIEIFEEEFSRYCGSDFGVSCTSCYAALHLACMAIGLGRGDEVIVPTFTMSAPLVAVCQTGARPVLVDCNEDTWNIDENRIEEKITEKTKAIIAVHIYGHPCEMDKIMEIAKKYGLIVIEDAAEAHGAEYRGKRVGGIGDIGCFSFFGNKILTCGEGGMAITNNPEYVERMKKFRNYAFEEPRFLHRNLGANYRITNLQAGIGVAQVENAQMLVESRRSVGLRYNRLLKDVKGIILPVERDECKNVYWMYGVVLEDEVQITREEFVERLKEKGIDSRDFFIPMNKQPVFLDGRMENAPDCKGFYGVAEKIGRRGFYLPSSSDLTDKEIEFVCGKLKELLSECLEDEKVKENY
jgi:perosamine synthetase